jgi:hypothetical protein
MSYRFVDSLRAGSGFHPDPARKQKKKDRPDCTVQYIKFGVATCLVRKSLRCLVYRVSLWLRSALLPGFYAAENPKIAQTSFAQRRKPEMSLILWRLVDRDANFLIPSWSLVTMAGTDENLLIPSWSLVTMAGRDANLLIPSWSLVTMAGRGVYKYLCVPE